MNNKLHVYTGNGKGKTTAAMGLAVRSAGHGRRVLIAQFLKDGRSGELNAFKMLPSVEVYPMKPVNGFVFAMSEEEKRQTEKEQRAQALALRTHIEQSRPELIVLDELNVALSTGCWIEKQPTRCWKPRCNAATPWQRDAMRRNGSFSGQTMFLKYAPKSTRFKRKA